MEPLFRDTTLAPLAFAIGRGWALLLLSLIVYAVVLAVAVVIRRRSGAPG
jgi:hypothetical protein